MTQLNWWWLTFSGRTKKVHNIVNIAEHRSWLIELSKFFLVITQMIPRHKIIYIYNTRCMLCMRSPFRAKHINGTGCMFTEDLLKWCQYIYMYNVVLKINDSICLYHYCCQTNIQYKYIVGKYKIYLYEL